MNVLISINKLDMGGAARVVYELAKNIDKSLFKLKIVCIDGKSYSFLERQMLDENYDITFLKCPRLKNGFIAKVLNKIFSFYFDIISIIRLYKELNKIKPNIIHAHQCGIWAGYWTIFHKVPLITTVHSRPDGTFNRFTEKFILHLTIYLHCNILVAISKNNMKEIVSYWHLNSKYARYVNNGININKFYSASNDIITFINVSRQDKNKNQSLILRAFYKLANESPSIPIQLYLIGDGDTHNSLVKESYNLGINAFVIFIGYIPSVTQYLSCSDVYISSANREGLSLSVLEAMASRLPIIATDAGGVRDLAEENGILVPCNDEEALYIAMKQFRDNEKLRISKGKKSFEIVQNYSSINMAKNYCNIYQEFSKIK